jgi:hypothetical protein
MRLRQVVVGLVFLAVCIFWVTALIKRLPYLDQIPVFDADVTTAAANMWLRIWWNEGALQMWFATPRSPLSIETPTLAARTLYESWPPGAFVPIYFLAKLFAIEPSVPLVNWFNVVMNGVIALAVAFATYNIARLARVGPVVAGFIAVGATVPTLRPPGIVYIFSQVYDVVTAVLPYCAIFILLEVLSYRATSRRDRNIFLTLQLVIIYLAFFVDWLSYSLFAFWLLTRLTAGWLKLESRWTRLQLAGLLLMPLSAFSAYLVWRFFSPGSLFQREGFSSSVGQLLEKIAQRMNLTQKSPITGFANTFVEIHANYYSPGVLLLIAGSTLATAAICAVLWYLPKKEEHRRSVFATTALLGLVVVPFYGHMLLFYQHTAIHQWAASKALFAYALVPFALLPANAFLASRILSAHFGRAWLLSLGHVVVAASAAIGFFSFAYAIGPRDHPALAGRIDRNTYLMWDEIGRNTAFQDVVVSPTLEAPALSTAVGVSSKRVYRANDFADAETVVENVCGNFNLVVVVPEGAEFGDFASRQPAETIDTGRIRMLRFPGYRGRALGCR